MGGCEGSDTTEKKVMRVTMALVLMRIVRMHPPISQIHTSIFSVLAVADFVVVVVCLFFMCRLDRPVCAILVVNVVAFLSEYCCCFVFFPVRVAQQVPTLVPIVVVAVLAVNFCLNLFCCVCVVVVVCLRVWPSRAYTFWPQPEQPSWFRKWI